MYNNSTRKTRWTLTTRRIASVCIAGLLLACILLWLPSLSHAQDSAPISPYASWTSGDSDETRSVAWGDVDGDGDLDLAVGNTPTDGVGGANKVYLNHGGVLQTDADNPWTSDDSDETMSVAWGDMDGDGDLDLAAGNWRGANKVYLNHGGVLQTDADNPWTSFYSYPTYSVAWGDMDGDGDLDLAVGNYGGVNRVYLNHEGRLQTLDDWDSGDSDNTMSVAWGDVDGDGDLDLAAGNDGGANKVYLNHGGVLQTNADNPWTSGDNDKTMSVAWGDVDGDGDPDLAVGNWWTSANKVYLNHGGELQTDNPWTSGDSDSTTSVAWGDVDGDGDLDLAAGNWTSTNKVYLNRGGELQTDNPWTSGDSDWTWSVAWGDVDGDGDLDLAAGNTRTDDVGGANKVYLNHGGSVLQTDNPWTSGDSDEIYSVAWGDVDGDGDLDLAAGNWYGANKVYLNHGGVLQTDNPWTSGDNANTTSVAWGDVDGDGDLDLAAGNYDSANKVYLNDGGKLQTDNPWTSGDSDATMSVAWGDVDGDGDLDLAVGNYDSANKVYLNHGGALQTDKPWTSGDSDETRSVAWGDVDGDGDLDLAAGNWWTSANKVYLNHGGVLQTSAAWTSGDGDWTRSVAWGDVDGDGDLDLAVGNDGSVNRVYLNHGGVLQTAADNPWFSHDSDGTYSVAWGDVDGDGDLDLAAGNKPTDGVGGANKVYLNHGGVLQTSAAWTSDDSDQTYSVAWGDMDGDGDLDLAAGNWLTSANKVYLNSRQGLATALLDGAPYIATGQPYNLSAANFYAISGSLDSLTIPITHTLFAPQGGLVGGIEAFYSPDGGGRWLPAVATTDTLTTNLAAGQQVVVSRVYSPTQDIPNDPTNPLSVSLAITDTRAIADLDVWLLISHTHNADLQATLVSPRDCAVSLFSSDVLSGSNLTSIAFDDQAPTAIVSGAHPYTGTFQPEGSLAACNGEMMSGTWTLLITDTQTNASTGALAAWRLRVKTPPVAHTYTWDTSASGFFGQSDNVVLRFVAHPQASTTTITGTYRYTNTIPGPLQQAYASAVTFPFRVRGTQVQVFSETVNVSNTVENALVYHLPGEQSTGGLPLADGSGSPFRTDQRGYLQGRGEIGLGDGLLALLPVHADLNYEGALEFDGEDDYVIRNPLHNAPITETTVSFWMHSEDTTGWGTPFSYASPLTDDTFLVAYYSNNFIIYRGDGISVFAPGVSATDGEWHHIAVAWRSSDGQARLYKDGVAAYTGVLAAGSVISPGGSLALGKDQNRDNFFEGMLDEVRVWNVARTEAEIQADMYRSLDGDEPGLVAYWPFNDPLTADVPSALRAGPTDSTRDHSASGNDATLYGATRTGDFYGGYTVYHTSAAPTATGLDMFTVITPGVQELTVSAAHPLLLLDLNVSLEWDARNDQQFISQLEYDLQRTSELLYDWSNGQAALGQVYVYHDQGYWAEADVRIYATNRMRPNANQGGIVTQVLTDPLASTISYAPGQVRVGALWNRYGETSGALGEDWPRALAHELGHYALFLDDNYIGRDEAGRIIPVDDCPGAMGDPYLDAHSEFHPDTGWLPGCERTLSHQATGRSDWATIAAFYPWLITPTVSLTDEDFNSGPSLLPLALTQVEFVGPVTPTTALEVPIFYLLHEGQRALPENSARAFLFQDEWLVDLGGATRDEVRARGARPGDRLCVYELAAGRQGCETISAGDAQLELLATPDWQPKLIITPVNSRTTAISVTAVPAGESLYARLFPVDGPASQPISLTYTGGGYSGTLGMQGGVPAAYVQVWADAHGETPRREVVADYVLGGNPANWYGSGANWYGSGANWYGSGANWYGSGANWYGSGANWYGSGANWYGSGAYQRSRSAPAMSTDGQVILFGEELDFAADEFLILHAATSLPSAQPWTTVVGQAYRLTLSPNVTDTSILSGVSLSFQYLGGEVPAGEESWLRLYYWDRVSWEPLPTELDTHHNLASAPVQGGGLYALMSSLEIPLYAPGWNLFAYPVQATRPVTDALLSISDYYTTVYGYDATTPNDPWKVYDKSLSAEDQYANQLTVLEFGKGYWISVTQAITLQVKGSSDVAGAASLAATGGMGSPPATYYGPVQASEGVTVSAWVDGYFCGQGQTQAANGGIVYSIDVLAEGPADNSGCGALGRTVTFYVDGRAQSPRAAWDNSRLYKLALNSGYRVYLPLVLKLQ